jgi:hypothetical protein
MADATHRDEFDRLLIELADQHNAQPGTWLNHAPGRALARSSRVRRLVRRVRDHGQDRRDVRGATSMSACIVRGHTASPLNT